MKILQVFNRYRFRGGEEAWVDGIAGLLGDQAVVDELRFQSSDWTGPGRPSLLKQILLIGDNPESRRALREQAERFRPDVLLFHNVIPVGSLGLYFEARQLGIPVLQYTHNFRPFSPGGTLWDGRQVLDAALHGNPWPEILHGAWQGSRLKTAILAWHLQHAIRKGLLDCVDHWLAISDFMRDCFIDAGIPAERITSMRHCFHAPALPEADTEGCDYLFLGRLVAEKGVITLVDAWHQLEQRLGDACPRLILAGDGPLEEEIRRRAASMGKVSCVGFVDGVRKAELLKTCRALIVPSIWWEPLGLSTYEAYAVGRPVIAARSGALQETVIEGETGWFHEPGSARDLARAIMVAEQAGPEQRTRLGRAGHQWLLDHAHPDAWKRKFLSLCERMKC